ncbi:MAG: hydrogenase formation protein HypD [Planctomycetota bacterium]
MKYVDEYRRPGQASRLIERIRGAVTRPWTIMEVCGGQTHSLLRHGIDQALPGSLRLVHGPGCPVCVTPVEKIDLALAIASLPGVLFCSFGDMLRVPGSRGDLLKLRSEGGDIRVVHSPLDAVQLAERHPEREVVFFAVGFETTAPATALAAVQAKRLGLKNFSLLLAHVLVPPAMAAVLEDPRCRVQGFLAAGHVATVVGYEACDSLAERFRVPIVVTGFEPIDLLEGILMLVRQLESGRHEVENQYSRSAKKEGNRHARAMLQEVFDVCGQSWRGLGMLPGSGLRLNEEYCSFDAESRFGVEPVRSCPSDQCRAGEVLQGLIRPDECSAFGTLCTPEHPLGAPMVSNEGACAAYWSYRRRGFNGIQPTPVGHGLEVTRD